MITSVARDEDHVERRQHPRHLIAVPCRLAGVRGVRWTENLSLGGALLVPAGRIEPGARLDLQIHFTWCEPVSLSGLAVHRRDGGIAEVAAAGVRFRHLEGTSSEAVRRALDAMPGARRQGGAPLALVMAAPGPLRRALEADLGHLGIGTIGVERPLDAIWRLIAGTVQIGCVLVTLERLRDSPTELFRFLEDEFPSVIRAVLYEPPLPPEARKLLEARHVHALLPIPWSDTMLAALLRIQPGWR